MREVPAAPGPRERSAHRLGLPLWVIRRKRCGLPRFCASHKLRLAIRGDVSLKHITTGILIDVIISVTARAIPTRCRGSIVGNAAEMVQVVARALIIVDRHTT